MIATLLAPAVALLLSAPPALLLNAPPAPLLNAPPAPTQKLRPNKKSIAATSAFLDQSEFFGFSGVVLIAVGDKVLLHEGYGFADAGAGIPNGPETVFEIASITKPITAAAVLSLVEDELIDLDDSIADLLPGVDREYADIQVEHLLAHTSGVGAGNDGGRGEDLAQAVSGYLGTRSQRKAGKVFDYWNGGYALLAGIVESKVEGSYVDYCRSRLFERAGLESTGFTGDEERWEPERQAVGYAGGVPVRLASGHAYDDVYDYRYRGMGGVVTTAEELWRLTRAITEGDLLEDRLQRK
ncbi:MAG: serine hydrolase domain-containing protein, partial [Planctomycetota bacterium]